MRCTLPIFIVIIISFSYCTKPTHLFLNGHAEQVIALQPLDSFSKPETDSIMQSLHYFFNKPVILLPSISIPLHYLNTAIQQYNADSVLTLLSKLLNDSLAEIVGITHQRLFTIKDAKPLPFFDQNIFGMGYQPGNASVVSDFRFAISNTHVYNSRIKNVILHEMGHNLGLSHCPNDKCIMSENNGNITTLDNCSNNYCSACRKKLH